jgi:hypothetical protein
MMEEKLFTGDRKMRNQVVMQRRITKEENNKKFRKEDFLLTLIYLFCRILPNLFPKPPVTGWNMALA